VLFRSRLSHSRCPTGISPETNQPNSFRNTLLTGRATPLVNGLKRPNIGRMDYTLRTTCRVHLFLAPHLHILGALLKRHPKTKPRHSKSNGVYLSSQYTIKPASNFIDRPNSRADQISSLPRYAVPLCKRDKISGWVHQAKLRSLVLQHIVYATPKSAIRFDNFNDLHFLPNRVH